jgi:hypothetical protein
MQQPTDTSIIPDIIAELHDAMRRGTSNIYTDDYFHMEFDTLLQERSPPFYQLFIQGYVTLTPQGFSVARHFFKRVEDSIEDEDLNPYHFFANEPHQSVTPTSVPPVLSSHVLFPYVKTPMIWDKFYTHPKYEQAFRFRFLVESHERGNTERETGSFYQVNTWRLCDDRCYNAIIHKSPDLFLRQPYYDPDISTDDILLLTQFKW